MTTLQEIEERFELHLQSVDELISFDRHILDVCINHLDVLNERLRKGPPQISNQTYLAEGALKAMKKIRVNDSLRMHYLSMFNSCLVLQVSYYTSIIDDIFKHTCYCLNFQQNRQDLDVEFLKSKNDINFQNMFSLIKTYKKYLDVEIGKDGICNTIILAQSSRHAIVHSLGIADQKFITQTTTAKPRDIKNDFCLNEKIQFTPSELDYVKLAMLNFVSDLCDEIKKRHSIR